MSQLIDISLIKENPANPRSITPEQFKKLVKSIRRFPEMLKLRPIVINTDNIVLGGNMRLRACIEAGLTRVPVVIADLTEAQEQEFIVRDNLNYGEWDLPKLHSADWDAAKLKDWGIDVGQLKETPNSVKPVTENRLLEIRINCNDERQQKMIFEELKKRGFKCKLLM